MLKKFGFFDEFEESKKFSILQAKDNADKDEGEILNYLKNGNRFMTIPGVIKDCLREDEKLIGAPVCINRWTMGINISGGAATILKVFVRSYDGIPILRIL